MMEIKTEPNKSAELYPDDEISNMVDHNSIKCITKGRLYYILFFLEIWFLNEQFLC